MGMMAAGACRVILAGKISPATRGYCSPMFVAAKRGLSLWVRRAVFHPPQCFPGD